MKERVKAFIKSTQPVYPVIEYLLWDAKQDQKINELNYQMWRNLTKSQFADVMPELDRMAENGDLEGSVEEILRKGWLIHSYHHHIDQLVKNEIAELTGG